MALPRPEPGLVISYAYLWHHEYETGQIEGLKYRPVVIVLSVEKRDNDLEVTVVPVTHSPPDDRRASIEIPSKVKRHLGLDAESSWIIIDEVNQFIWPGYDVLPLAGRGRKRGYGFIPPKLFEKIKQGVLDLIIRRRNRVTPRD